MLTSCDEGTPNAILEAMSCGVPVVSTSINGIPDVVTHGKHGFLASVDDHQSLADYMHKILTNDACAIQMGQASREHIVTNFSLENATKQHEVVYKKLCSRMGLLA